MGLRPLGRTVATQARTYQVGGFVITALVLAVVTMIWLGSTRLFQRTVTVATYFPESVQGLERGAPVKYRGVPAGRVEDIHIAPDPALIEVVMRIDREFAPLLLTDPTLRTELELIGISGLRYVEVSAKSGPALAQHPVLDFVPQVPVIPSSPSTFRELADAFDDVYEKLMGVDLVGVSDDLRATLGATTDLLTDARLNRTLTHLEDVAASGGQVARELARITGDARLDRTVTDLRVATGHARTLLADLSDGPELREIVQGVARLTEAGESTLRELQLTVERLDATLGEVEGLTQTIRDQPSLLLFSEPAAPREPGRGRRR